MDGLSAGASVLAVISLAIQLGAGAREVVEFFQTIADAPSELIRLKDLVSLVHTISVGIRNALEHQRRLHGDFLFGIDAVDHALKACYDRLVLIRKLLDQGPRSEHGQSVVSRSWAKFKIALKKDTIEELESQLGHALQALNVSLTVNLMWSSSRSPLIVIDRLEEKLALLLGEHRSMPPLAPMQQNVGAISPHRRRSDPPLSHAGTQLQICNARPSIGRWPTVTASSSVTGWSQSIPGIVNIVVERTVKKRRTTDGSTEFKSEKTLAQYTITPSFVSWSIEFLLSRSVGLPSVGLKFRRIIPGWNNNSDLGIILRDDLPGLQKMLTTGKWTVDCLIGSGQSSLLGRAARFRSERIFRFLIAQGCKASLGDLRDALYNQFHHDLPLDYIRACCSHCGWDEDESDSAMEVITSRIVIPWTPKGQIVACMEFLAMTWVHETLMPTPEYLGAIICRICQYWLLEESERSRRDALVLSMIRGGAKIHYINGFEASTPLKTLLCCTNPAEVDGAANHWLGLLESAGVDLVSYLESEMGIWNLEVNHQPTQIGDYRCIKPWRAGISFSGEGHRQPYITHTTVLDPKSQATPLLEEFHFCADLSITGPYFGCAKLEYLVHHLGGWDEFVGWRRLDHQAYLSLADLLARWKEEHGKTRQVWVKLRSRVMEDLSLPIYGMCRCKLSGGYIDLWPFYGRTHTMCSSGNFLGGGCLRNTSSLIADKWCSRHQCTFNHERFVRKQAKKGAKAAKWRGRRTAKSTRRSMPGSWVD